MPKVIEGLNEVLNLKGSYSSKNNEQKGGAVNLVKGGDFEVSKFLVLIEQLKQIYEEWSKIDLISGLLINVQYKRVIPKSSRVQVLLNQKGRSDSTIVGARFINKRHRITHYLPNRNDIKETINLLEKAYEFSKNFFGDSINRNNFNIRKDRFDPVDYSNLSLPKTIFRKLIVEVSNIDAFEMPRYENKLKESNYIVSFYKTDIDGVDILKKLDIKPLFYKKLDSVGNLFQIDRENFERIVKNASFLICNSTTDFMSITNEDAGIEYESKFLKDPTNEPTIGVIDSSFQKGTYFNNWVDYHDEYYDDFQEQNDFHGTEIDSILVDGGSINKDRYDDGCGNFRVRHFHVASKNGVPSTTLMERIESIVLNNPDIHVWNLCIGSNNEIDENYISYEASILDKLQSENKNIVFVVAGTNIPDDPNIDKQNYRIGAPADSINSIVVNSVDLNNKRAPYSRKGGVLSFFNKPDVAAFGGSNEGAVRVCNNLGESYRTGTSFAAPWISRKMCYLMDKMNLSREAAKALIIDSAAKWNGSNLQDKEFLGYGVVPTEISKILKTDSNEIRFILTGQTLAYNTYNYNLPVPLDGDKYPFIARATLCYFPPCDRLQGVDYTSTELSLKFGRLKNDRIDDINENNQDDADSTSTEEEARRYQRKWDNVKHISMSIKDKKYALKSYENKMWGISVTKKDRLSRTEHLAFAVVVTLREINDVNRIETFIEQCQVKGWYVEKINISEKNELFIEAQEDIKFEN